MKRPASSENVLKLIQQWRSVCPDILCVVLSSLAFQARRIEEFEELLEFIEEAQLDRVGAFKYSPVDGAAANALPDHIDPDVQEDPISAVNVFARRNQCGKAC